MTEYHTLNDLMELSTQQQKEIWEIVQQAEIDESERTAEESYHKMLQMYEAMKSADSLYDGELRSPSKRAGGDGALLINIMNPAKIYAVTSLEKSWKKL